MRHRLERRGSNDSTRTRGPRGFQGVRGATGETGATGPAGAAGPTGRRGPAGPAPKRAEIVAVIEDSLTELRKQLDTQLKRFGQVQQQLDQIHELVRKLADGPAR